MLHLPSYVKKWTLPWFILQVNRIKIPKQMDELVEMESESGNPVSKVFFRIKAETRGVNIFYFTFSSWNCLLSQIPICDHMKCNESRSLFRSIIILWSASTTLCGKTWCASPWCGSLCHLGELLSDLICVTEKPDKSNFFGQIIAPGSLAGDHIAILSSCSLCCAEGAWSWKSVTACGSILVHWGQSGSRDTARDLKKRKRTAWKHSLKSHRHHRCPLVFYTVECIHPYFCQQHSLAHDNRLVCDIPISLYGCRYYGLSVWFPDVIKHLQADDYASKVKIHSNERIEDFTFNFTLENQIHRNGLFINDR